MYVNILYLLQYTFFSMKIRAQRAREQNRAQESPTGTAYLIGKAPQIWHRINALQPPPAPPRAPKHPRCIYYTLLPPKYTISRPQCTQQQAHPPACHIWHCCHLFTSASSPCSTPPPYYTPLPSHPAPSAYPIPYPLTQNMLFVILTSPSSPAYTLVYSVFWVVGLVPYTLIMYVGLNPSIDI